MDVQTLNGQFSRCTFSDADHVAGDALITAFVKWSHVIYNQIATINNSETRIADVMDRISTSCVFEVQQINAVLGEEKMQLA